MRIAITGASGFIGQEVIDVLRRREDVEIIGLTRTDRPAEEKVSWRTTDYTLESLTNVLADVDSVIHLAAVRGTAGRLSDYSVNETLTEDLLLAMGECGVKKIVFASSIAVYSDLSMMPWKEDMMLTPKTLYGITKAACEHLIMYYSKKYGFQYSIVRIAQVLGSGERRRVMTNVFMEQAAKGQQLRVMGKSTAHRQYIYSRDLAELLSQLGRETATSIIVNAGMETACTNLEIARIVNEVYHNETPIDYDDSTEETIEPSIMSTEKYHTFFDRKLLEMKEALEDLSSGE